MFQKQQASFYQKILEGVPGEEQGEPDTFYPRQDPSYYRVSYYGQSFPAFVRVGFLQFILRSLIFGFSSRFVIWEKLGVEGWYSLHLHLIFNYLQLTQYIFANGAKKNPEFCY